MAQRREVYKCAVCGNVVEVLRGGAGELVCCGQPMSKLDEQTADSTVEKHVPVIETVGDGVKVTVGSIPHPMEEKHYIEWIELLNGKAALCRQHLEPGDPPEAVFRCGAGCCGDVAELAAREHCNVHGLWKG